MKTNRYLIDFDTSKLKSEYHDILIIGSGIAGVYTALELDEKYDVAILTKETVEISNSVLAQGGIAVSLDKNDSPEMHLQDTLYAGAGLCDEASVRVLVNEAAGNIKKVCAYGVEFDKHGSEMALTREGAHSKNRIIHAGDATGKEVCDKLIIAATRKKNITISEQIWVLDLLLENGVCIGLLAYDVKESEVKVFYAGMIICASGGYGQLYLDTTNPEVATGDGAAFAYRAGAELMDLEFIQFHPTVLYHPQNKSFLISEAVRGEGAYLRNSRGERFMLKYHELGELAPRDVVSRCIFKEMKITGDQNVFVDITFKDKEYLENRFPTIYKTCMSYGIDMAKDYIPVAPAEHYCMGGIKTNINGGTSIKNFYVCGEAACNGIHGANRLASNSLLEGLVFGSRIGAEADSILSGAKKYIPITIKSTSDRKFKEYDRKQIIQKIKNTMSDYVGIVRNQEGLNHALEILHTLNDEFTDMQNICIDDFAIQDEILIAEAIIQSAIERQESRGAHFRADFPVLDDAKWKKNIIRRI